MVSTSWLYGNSDWGKSFYLQLELIYLQSSFFAYSPLMCFLDTLSHSKQQWPNRGKQINRFNIFNIAADWNILSKEEFNMI